MSTRCAAVTGATGRIGARLMRALLEAGIRVRALSRTGAEPLAGVDWVIGDLFDPVTLRELLDGADVVIHAAGQLEGPADQVERSLVTGTRLVADAAKQIRMVHISSLVVLDTAHGPELIDEGSPLEPTPERRGVYTRAKCAAEELMRARAATQDVVIVRPGIVVDHDLRIPASVVLAIGSLRISVGPGGAAMPVVHADDAAAGLVVAAVRASAGDLLHLIDPHSVTRDRLYARLDDAERSGVRINIGGAVLAAAKLANRTRLPTLGDAAYRILSAGSPHRWPAQRIIDLGWRPAHLARWLGDSGSN
ncbi:MAG TPA: NAD-dependent epimerase/dehydratase family protein [Gemmatimonadales bacterium]